MNGIERAREIMEAERRRDSQRYWRAMNRAAVRAVRDVAHRESCKVLEIGCGTGRLTKWLSPHCEWVVRIDLQPRFSLVERESDSNKIVLLQADGLDLCFADETFDVIVAMEVIEYVEDDHRFVAEALRVLKDEEVFFFTTPNRQRLTSRIRVLLGRPILFPHCYDTGPVAGEVVHVKEYTRGEILGLLSNFQVGSVKVEGMYLGIPAWRIGLVHPPSWAYGWSFNWHVRVIKQSAPPSTSHAQIKE